MVFWSWMLIFSTHHVYVYPIRFYYRLNTFYSVIFVFFVDGGGSAVVGGGVKKKQEISKNQKKRFFRKFNNFTQNLWFSWNIRGIPYEEVSKKKVVSVHFGQVYWPQLAGIPKHTRGPQIRWELAFSSSQKKSGWKKLFFDGEIWKWKWKKLKKIEKISNLKEFL